MSALEELQELFNAEPDTERISLRSRRLEQIDVEMEYLQFHFTNIRHLDLSDNALEVLPADFGLLLPKLVALDITRNKFRSIADVGEILQKCGSLKSLSVTLKSPTEEKLLLMMLPKLRILNGTPLSSPASPPPPPSSLQELLPDSPTKSIHALSTVLMSPSTASNSSAGGDDSMAMARTDSPTITSPQDKRTFRLQFANLKIEHHAKEDNEKDTKHITSVPAARKRRVHAISRSTAAVTKGSTTTKKTMSVRPTEQPATISDDKTDWHKLLKSQTSSNEENGSRATALGGNDTSAMSSVLTKATSQPLVSPVTETFLSQLKAVVKAFHQCDQSKDAASSQQQLIVYEQLDRHVDKLASQLSRQESEHAQSNSHAAKSLTIDAMKKSVAMLQTRWNLLEVCGLYGVEKANGVDGTLGNAFAQLLQMQKDVLVALQRQQATVVAVQSQVASLSEGSNSDHQHQMKVLLEVAESLESDLEAVQTRLQQEKAQRELVEQENWSLKRENESFKRKSSRALAEDGGRSSSSPTTEQHGHAYASGAPTHTSMRRIRKRSTAATATTNTRMPSATSTANASPTLGNFATPSSSKAVIQIESASPSHGATCTRYSGSTVAAATTAATAPMATRIRSLTLKQLVDLIHCIATSKQKYDTKCFDVGAPRETMEQHMYTYLNQRFGLHALTVEYASAIWKGCEQFATQENDAAMFLALLHNQVDEAFVSIKKKLQQALADLLRAYFQAKYPMKQETTIAALVQTRLQNVIYEEEWHEMLTYLYDPQDSATLLRLVRQKAETWKATKSPPRQGKAATAAVVPWAASTRVSKTLGSSNRQRPASTTAATREQAALPFSVFEQVLYDYQLQGRRKLLEGFRAVFESYDTEHVGVVNHESFAAIVREITQTKSDAATDKLLATVDPFHHDIVTFSDAVSCLLVEIRAMTTGQSPANAAALPRTKPQTSVI
uniref:EF-hand domain-containing protein n=1 Tax=Globisporangium ultimum (strain ATCC 200006 / CBS 805.95 / DAOM BR144) TaxID=431595 RepID=K3WAN0_GLOUD